MKSTLNLFQNIIIISMVFSCSTKNEINQNGLLETHRLKETEELKLPLDERTSHFTLSLQMFKDLTSGEELLVYFNQNKPSIQ